MSSITTENYNVGGIAIDVFTLPHQGITSNLPVAVLFLLHGRTSSKKQVIRLAHAVLDHTKEQIVSGNGGKPSHELYAISLDHRNHGDRTVNAFSNESWDESGAPDKHNPRHAVDMYALQVGTARDISFLIDHIPAYLFPNDERIIERWGVAGISLGGHTTWNLLKDEPRVRFGIPIIGCPDFLELMKDRARQHDAVLPAPADGPPNFPKSLVDLVNRTSPVQSKSLVVGTAENSNVTYSPTSSDPIINPFIGKKILILSGGSDPLVPWKYSKDFVDKLVLAGGDAAEGDTGSAWDGKKEVIIEEKAKHEVTPAMVGHVSRFVWDEFVSQKDKTSARI